MKKIKNIKLMRFLKLIHIIGAGMFIGGIFSLFVLLKQSGDFMILQSVMDEIVLMGMRILILSGLIYGIFTNYGFIKNTWVWMKWVLSIVAMFCLMKLNISIESMLLQGIFILAFMVLSEYRFRYTKKRVS